MIVRDFRRKDALGVFDAPNTIPGGPDMKCPVCGEHTPPSWHPFQTHMASGLIHALKAGKDDVQEDVSVDWMRCGNEECEQLVVRMQERQVEFVGNIPIEHRDSWLARPRFGQAQRPIDALIPEPFRKDYAEAGAILDLSHRMSAVLARKIVSDLLRKYAGRSEKRLTAQIDAYVTEPGHPGAITSGLHHVREAADMSAHTMEEPDTSEEPAVIEIDREEAEWTLDFVDRLFVHFIVQPAKDAAIKARIEEKGARAGRRPLTADESEGAT